MKKYDEHFPSMDVNPGRLIASAKRYHSVFLKITIFLVIQLGGLT